MSLKKQAFLNTVGNFIYLIAIWLFTVITTHQLGYEDVGNLTLAIAIGNVFFYIQTFGFRTFQCSDMSFKFSPSIYLRTRLVLSVIGLALCFITCIALGYKANTVKTIMLYLLFKTSEAISDVLYGDDQRFNRLEMAGISLALRGLIVVVSFCIGSFILKSLNWSLLLVVCSGFAMTLCVDYPVYRGIVHEYNANKKGLIKELLVETFPLFLATLLPVVITALPRVTLDKYYGSDVLGYYGNISTPALLITTMVPTVLTAILPSYGKMHIKNDRARIFITWIKTLAATIVLTWICCLGVYIVGRPIMSFLYTDAILPYMNYLYYILLSMMLFAFTSCNGAVLVAIRENKVLMITVIIALVLSCVTVLPLVRLLGISGAIIVLAIAYFGQGILQASFIAQYCKSQ